MNLGPEYIRKNLIRIAGDHGWECEQESTRRVVLVRRTGAQCLRLWVDFNHDGTVMRALAAWVGGPEQALRPVMSAVHAFLQRHGR